MLDPISSDNPAGSDVGYEPEFEEVQAEIGKLESLSGAQVDWPLVADRATGLLTAKTKDFRVGSWLAAALLHEKGYAGLAQGLETLAGLVDGYWDNGFPPKKRLRARINMFEWLAEHTGRAIQDKPPPDPDNAQKAAAVLGTLREKLDALLADKSPGMNDLHRVLSAASSSSPAPESATAAPETAPSPEPEPAPAPEAAPTPEAPADPEPARDDAGDPAEYGVDWVIKIATPIPGDKPGGEDVTFHPDFETLEAEVAKLGSVHGDQPDWNEVVRLGKLILSDHSKDLRAAGPLALGLYQTEGLPGMALGLAAYDRLLLHFWEDLWPAKKRMRGRLAGIEWTCERLGREIEKLNPESLDQGQFKACCTLAQRLQDTVAQTTEGKTDAGALISALRTKQEELDRVAPPPPKQQPKATTAAQSGPASSPAASASAPAAPAVSEADLGNSEEVLKKLKDFQAGLKRMGSALRSANQADPTAYRLTRIGAWLSLSAPPPAQAGKTRLPPPPKDAGKRLEEMAERKDFAALLEAAETRFSDAIFWLDAQRFVHQAMAGLGKEYEAAGQCVAEETAALIRRVPELVELSFSNGAPFADGQTRMWIETEVMAASGSGGGSVDAGTSVESEDATRFTEAAKEAKPLAAKGQLAEALNMMQDAAARSSAGRGRFLGRLMLAGFCREIERFDIGLSILSGLEKDIERMGLVDWEPALCVKVFSELTLCEQGRLKAIAKPAATDMEGVRIALEKLCQLDAASALKLAGPGK